MENKNSQIDAEWQSVKNTSTGQQHHGLYYYLKDNPEIITSNFKFSTSRDGRNYVMIDLPAKDSISRHLTIDAIYDPKINRLTPFHLTREITSNQGEVLIQHAYISFAKAGSDSIYDFVLTEFDAKKFAAEIIRVKLSEDDKDELRCDVDDLLMPILLSISAERNRYLKIKAKELFAKESQFAKHAFMKTLQRLSTAEINILIKEFTEQQQIYALLYHYEEHSLDRQTHPSAVVLREIIDALQAAPIDAPPIRNDSLEVVAAKPQARAKKKKKKGQQAIVVPSADVILQELGDLLAKISQCTEEEIPHLSAEVLIVEDFKLGVAQNLIDKCNREISKRTKHFVRIREQQQESLQNKVNKFKQLQYKFSEANERYIAVFGLAGSLAEEEIAEFNPYECLEIIIIVATICKQLQKQFIVLKASAISLSIELDGIKTVAFDYVNTSLKSWLECAVICRSVPTIKKLIELFPLTRVYLDDLQSDYVDIIPRFISLSHTPRSKMSTARVKTFKTYLNLIDFLFANSSQFKQEFLHLTKVNLVVDGHLIPEKYRKYAEILLLGAKNGHEDTVKLFVKLGMQADKQNYMKAVLVFLIKLKEDSLPDALKYATLFKYKVPDLPVTIVRESKSPNLMSWIIFSSLLILVVVSALTLLLKPAYAENEDDSDLTAESLRISP